MPQDTGHHQLGQSSIETIGLACAIAVLVAASGVAMAGGAHRRALAARIAGRVSEAVASPGDSQLARSGRVRATHVRTAGQLPPRITDLRMHDLATDWAVRSWAGSRRWATPVDVPGVRDEPGALAVHADVRACAMCVGLQWRAEHALGATAAAGAHQRLHAGDVVGVDALTRAHLSVVHAAASAAGRLRALGTTTSIRVTAGGGVGVEGTLEARAELGRLRQSLTADAGGVAGASGHIEQRAAVTVAGVSLHETAGADGWLGAGIRGRLALGHDGPGKFSWDVRGGAALGVGGGAHLAGSIDLSHLMASHPGVLAQAALSALRAGPAAPLSTSTELIATARHRGPRPRHRRHGTRTGTRHSTTHGDHT